MEQPYTVIGAGGAIGAPLAQELLKNGKPVRLLSRSGKTMDGAESRSVDVFNQKELTEETPFNPSSKKGVVRAKIATMLLESVKRGEVTACIARSVDFYGPIMKEMVEMVYQNEQSYWFDSSKFEQKYGFQPTSYEDGIRETVKFFNLRKNA